MTKNTRNRILANVMIHKSLHEKIPLESQVRDPEQADIKTMEQLEQW